VLGLRDVAPGLHRPKRSNEHATLHRGGETFADLGIHPPLYWASDNYRSGAYDPYIQKSLEHADVILAIYRTVSTANHPTGWLPIRTTCENCGKIGPTAEHAWDLGGGD